MTKQIIKLTTIVSLALGVMVSLVQAQEFEEELVAPLTPPAAEATPEAVASASALLVDPEVKQIIQERKDQDVTETTGGKTDELAQHLLSQPAKELSWNNFLQTVIRGAVNRGLPSNLVVLLILFPLVSSVIAFSRHVVGLRGFGIYTPAVLSVALVSTGIPVGILMFVIIVAVSIFWQKGLKKINLAHLPKTALILWGVCVSVIAFLIVMAYGGVKSFFSLSIFPLLTLISLSENFTSTQLISSMKEAIRLTVETLILAIISALIIQNGAVQRFVIVYPGVALLLTLIVDVLIGRYSGLRLLELSRFKTLIKKE